ncbi:MAG: hypothetical protein ACRDPO_00105, partial [Streptosporangiaceae bacterium]
MAEAYITGVGAYLPGEPVDNEQLMTRLTDDTTRSARLGRQALAANGIRTRHYAVDDQGRTLMLNEELAASAARRALADRGIPASAVRMLATGTTQGDVGAEHFRAKLLKRLRAAGHDPDESRWFTNLHTAGNTGAASIFVMLEAARPRLRAGDRVLLVVPESGRFSLAFAQLTCVSPAVSPGAGREPSPAELAA